MIKPFRILDTHAHLMELKKKSPEQFLDFAKQFDPGSDFVLDVGISLKDTVERRELHSQLGIKHWSLGLYPSAALGDWRKEVGDLRSQLLTYSSTPDSGLCALGELGIDGLKPYGPEQDQLLKSQIALANEFHLPIIVHSRAAVRQCLDVFKKNPVSRGGIMHCYSEAPELVEDLVELGFYISFAGNISYKKSEAIVEAMKRVPIDRLLIETDSPYLSPEPHRSQVNTPIGSCTVAGIIAGMRTIETNQLLDQIENNISQLFRLKWDA